MDELIVVENRVDEEGIARLHLTSHTDMVPALAEIRTKYVSGDHGQITREDGVYHFRAEYPFAGAMEFKCEGWPKPKMFMLWNLSLCESVKRALYEAAMEYEKLFNERPQYAFIRKLPKGIENGVEVGSLMLFQADWMVRKCVAVGWQYR